MSEKKNLPFSIGRDIYYRYNWCNDLHETCFSIKKKVKGGAGTQGSKTLPSSNSSPVHSVPTPPHTGTSSVSYVFSTALAKDRLFNQFPGKNMAANNARTPPIGNNDNTEPISSAIVKYNYQVKSFITTI